VAGPPAPFVAGPPAPFVAGPPAPFVAGPPAPGPVRRTLAAVVDAADAILPYR
jgi:hypothetical protein